MRKSYRTYLYKVRTRKKKKKKKKRTFKSTTAANWTCERVNGTYEGLAIGWSPRGVDYPFASDQEGEYVEV